MNIRFDDNRINYYGRTDTRTDGEYFYFPSTAAEVRFKGTEISAVINNKTMWGCLSLGYVIDGRMGKIPLIRDNDGKDTTYQLANSLEPDMVHTLVIYKRHAANHFFALKEIIADEFLDAPQKPDLKLEFYGDSVSAGEVTEAFDFVGRTDPACHESVFDNSYLSYTWQTARLLNAQFNNIAQGGIAVFDDTGYFDYPKMVGMETVYNKTAYFPKGEYTDWDFSRYTPDAVIFALGQNDKHNAITNADDIDINDPQTRLKWKNGYKKIIKSIFSNYPQDTRCIMLTTLLMHGIEWDEAIDEIVNELKADGINAYHMLFKRNGAATPGHPRYQEHKEMAEELSEFIKSIL